MCSCVRRPGAGLCSCAVQCAGVALLAVAGVNVQVVACMHLAALDIASSSMHVVLMLVVEAFAPVVGVLGVEKSVHALHEDLQKML